MPKIKNNNICSLNILLKKYSKKKLSTNIRLIALKVKRLIRIEQMSLYLLSFMQVEEQFYKLKYK
jgi:hypothetical protein